MVGSHPFQDGDGVLGMLLALLSSPRFEQEDREVHLVLGDAGVFERTKDTFLNTHGLPGQADSPLEVAIGCFHTGKIGQRYGDLWMRIA